jgi:hypothetical protein
MYSFNLSYNFCRLLTGGMIPSEGEKKVKIMEESKNKRKLYGDWAQGNRARHRLDGKDERLPYPMIGFSLPIDRHRLPPVNRMLHEQARGRPFFYFENVARVPKETWSTISKKNYIESNQNLWIRNTCVQLPGKEDTCIISP